MKNRIARLVKLGSIEIVEEELQPLQEGELLVEVKSVGICGSDIHYFLEGGLGSFKQKLPMEMGHEPAGVVLDSFAKSAFKYGDRVAIEPGRSCLRCAWCLKGKHNLCTNVKFMGANGAGALANYVVVHESQLARIPAEMSFNLAALVEPLGIGLHAVNLIRPKHTENAVIMGAGPIGLCLMKMLHRAGMREIYLVDAIPSRVAFAKRMGATEAFSFSEAVEKIKKLTDDRGTTYAFDAAGTQDSILACGEIVAVSGTIGLIGIPTDDFIRYNPHKLRTKEVRVQNVRRSNQTLHDCIKLAAGERDLEGMITHTFDLKDVQKGFELVSTYNDGVIKCIITNT